MTREHTPPAEPNGERRVNPATRSPLAGLRDSTQADRATAPTLHAPSFGRVSQNDRPWKHLDSSGVERRMPRLLDADHSQILLLPPDISQWVPVHHPARFIWDLVECLDLDELGLCEALRTPNTCIPPNRMHG